MTGPKRLRNPEDWFASWHAGEHAYCECCRQRTEVLFGTHVAGAWESVCRSCAKLAVLVVAMRMVSRAR